eukprot:3313872-Pleurochrysis_carterae.AAC.2
MGACARVRVRACERLLRARSKSRARRVALSVARRTLRWRALPTRACVAEDESRCRRGKTVLLVDT